MNAGWISKKCAFWCILVPFSLPRSLSLSHSLIVYALFVDTQIGQETWVSCLIFIGCSVLATAVRLYKYINTHRVHMCACVFIFYFIWFFTSNHSFSASVGNCGDTVAGCMTMSVATSTTNGDNGNDNIHTYDVPDARALPISFCLPLKCALCR